MGSTLRQVGGGQDLPFGMKARWLCLDSPSAAGEKREDVLGAFPEPLLGEKPNIELLSHF